ncbi:hypothetical protein Tco_1104944 [Tanacetum coccineum]
MGQENYVEGCSMQRPPLLEADGFCFWKTRFETYIKFKDIDLWQVIQNGDFVFKMKDPKKDSMNEFLCAKPPRRIGILSLSFIKTIHKSRIARLTSSLKNMRSSQFRMKKLLIVVSHGSMLLSLVVGIKSFLMLFGITTVLIDVNAAQSKLMLLENFNENYSKCLRLLMKLQLSVQSYYCYRKLLLLEKVTTTSGS